MTQTEDYQPQVQNTTNGANIHTYIPRSDGTVMIGGVIYYPHGAVPTAVPAAATSTTVPAVARPYIIPPGGTAIPAFNVLDNPQYPYMQYHSPSLYYLTTLQVCLDSLSKVLSDMRADNFVAGPPATNGLPSARGISLPVPAVPAVCGPATAYDDWFHYIPHQPTGSEHFWIHNH